MRLRLRRLATGLGMALVIVSCAPQPTVSLPPMDDWSSRQAVLGSVDEWRARGRIGLVAGDMAESGSLDWRQQDRLVLVSIRGPLGAGGLTLEGDGSRLKLTDSNGETVLLTRPEAELEEIYGWTIPVESLPYWLLGIPDPARDADSRVAPEGWLESLEQAEWRVSYEDYRPAAGVMMPYRLKARTADIRLTIVVKDWRFGPSAAF